MPTLRDVYSAVFSISLTTNDPVDNLFLLEFASLSITAPVNNVVSAVLITNPPSPTYIPA